MKKQILLASFMLIAISGFQHASGIQKRVHVQRDFSLRSGRQALVKEAGMKLTFTALVEDSRCPEGVDCIWAGNGKISLTVKKGRHKSVSFDLNTTTEPRSFVYQGFEITLVKLAPYPKKDQTIKKSDYVVTLKVTKTRPVVTMGLTPADMTAENGA